MYWEYLENPETLPYILIEIFLKMANIHFWRYLNYEKAKESGISFKIAFNEKISKWI